MESNGMEWNGIGGIEWMDGIEWIIEWNGMEWNWNGWIIE